jgi:hypothetical protein
MPESRRPRIGAARGAAFHAARCVAIIVLILPAACALHKKATFAGAASLLEDVSRAASKQTDLRLVREALPAYLLLIDGMVEAEPDNSRLLITAAQSYASFASVLADETDSAYRSALLGRSKRYALSALERRGIEDPLNVPFDRFQAAVEGMGSEDLPYVFWTASCWGSWISAHMRSITALAELPRVETLMRRALALDETYHYGGPHLLMGIWYAARPAVAGGSLERARAHFLKAIEFGQGRFLMAEVYYADYVARKALDRELFVSTLRKVIATPADVVPELTLLNSVARRKAEALLAQADDIF